MAPSESAYGSSNPTSSLLQDALRERKAETQRVKKTYDVRDSQMDESAAREVQSSPLAPRDRSATQHRRVTGDNLRQPSLPRDMGIKEMELQFSKSKKQNFDLKVELFHLRQRNDNLLQKAERLESVEADNVEIQSINEALLLELERRDVALKEAVNFICDLEAKVEELKKAKIHTRESSGTPQTVISNGGASRSRDAKDSTSPTQPRTLSPEPENAARRFPSFLKEKNKSTNVLRSLCSNDGGIGSSASIISGEDAESDEDTSAVNSPRLSLLHESDFRSVYGGREEFDARSECQNNENAIPEGSRPRVERTPSPRRKEREARIQKWVEEKDRPATPTSSSSKKGTTDRYSSIGEVLEKVPSKTKENGYIANSGTERNTRQPRSPAKSERRARQRRPSSPAFGGPMFGGAVLPPTPGTMSTATITGSSSTPSIVTEKSFLDGTSLPAKGSSDSSFANQLGNALAAEGQSVREPESPSSTKSSRGPRPSLKAHATETVFSGEAYAAAQPSRTLSYPAPMARPRRQSGQLSPTSQKSSGEQSASSRHKQGRGAPEVTPRKEVAQQSRPRSPPTYLNTPTSTAVASKSQAYPDSKREGSTSFRSKIQKLTPSQSTQKSVASRLFRRSNSHAAAEPPAVQERSPADHATVRGTSPNRHARLPRPSSLYGSSPVYARPGTASNDDSRSSFPANPRRHSVVVSNGGDLLATADQEESIDSRQTSRPEDGKSKWTLGRTASARIREGLGFKRSMSTQEV